jgi:hypothetical protein
MLLVLVSETFLLIKQIRPAASQIYNLWTSVTILFQACASEAEKSIGYAFVSADDAFIGKVSKGAFIADFDKSGGAYIGVANRAFTVTIVAEATDGDAGLLATHDKVRVVARHGECFRVVVVTVM